MISVCISSLAAEQFHKLTKALEVLTDAAAKVRYMFLYFADILIVLLIYSVRFSPFFVLGKPNGFS